MGGHGGLNILHQKKWNVYNLDNRMKVEKDRREHREKQRRQRDKRRNDDTEGRLELLRGEHEHRPVQRQREPQPAVPKSNLITEELRRINEDKKHINLFEHEQRLLDNREQTQAKILKEREYLKDKNLEVASKFLGAYNDEKMKPWYLKTDNRTAPNSKDREYQLNHIKNSESQVTKQYLTTEGKPKNRRERSRSRSRDRKNGSSAVEDSHSRLQRLREERRVREEKQRKRAQELLRTHKV